jgi:hypothetical protein
MPAAGLGGLATIVCFPAAFVVGVVGIFVDDRRLPAVGTTVASAAMTALVYALGLPGALC